MVAGVNDVYFDESSSTLVGIAVNVSAIVVFVFSGLLEVPACVGSEVEILFGAVVVVE